MRRLLIIPALIALTLTGCTTGPSQDDCYDAFQEVLTPTMQAYSAGASEAELDAIREPIFEACGTVQHTVNALMVYPEVVGLQTREEIRFAALNTVCNARKDTAACEGYEEYRF